LRGGRRRARRYASAGWLGFAATGLTAGTRGLRYPGRVRRLLIAVVLLGPGCSLYFGDDDGAGDGGAAVDARTVADAGAWPTGSCTVPAPCPPATAGRLSLCGRIRDVGDDTVYLGDRPDLWCDPDAPGDGPCAVTLRLHDLFELAADPATATPLAAAAIGIDGCGRYFARDVAPPRYGFVAVVVDDAAGAADRRVTTLVAAPAAAGQQLAIDAASLTRALDQQWSTAASLPAPSFGRRGAVLLSFRRTTGQPVGGVQMTAGGAVDPAADWYFSDSSYDTRLRLSPALDATSFDGAALRTGGRLVEYSGTGSEVAGCAWESSLAAAIPDVLWVGQRVCELP